MNNLDATAITSKRLVFTNRLMYKRERR